MEEKKTKAKKRKKERTNQLVDIYTLKRKHNDAEKWYKRKCNDFFKITPTRELTPVTFFVRQSVTYTHVSPSKQTSSLYA